MLKSAENTVNVTVNTNLLDCGSAPAVPCVEVGGYDQPYPLQQPPCPEPKMPNRRVGGQWAGKEESEECPAVTHIMPDDSHYLGVLKPPAKRDKRMEKERCRQTDGDRYWSNQTERE